MHLARFPRRFLAHLPTPLERLDRLSAELGGPEIWIKRDDCTGLSTGGNKTRKLEFLMAEALEQGADMVMTQGATQSNHARQTAAFAAKLGLEAGDILDTIRPAGRRPTIIRDAGRLGGAGHATFLLQADGGQVAYGAGQPGIDPAFAAEAQAAGGNPVERHPGETVPQRVGLQQGDIGAQAGL